MGCSSTPERRRARFARCQTAIGSSSTSAATATRSRRRKTRRLGTTSSRSFCGSTADAVRVEYRVDAGLHAHDPVPYIGRWGAARESLHGHAFNKWGMPNGTASAMIIATRSRRTMPGRALDASDCRRGRHCGVLKTNMSTGLRFFADGSEGPSWLRRRAGREGGSSSCRGASPAATGRRGQRSRPFSGVPALYCSSRNPAERSWDCVTAPYAADGGHRGPERRTEARTSSALVRVCRRPAARAGRQQRVRPLIRRCRSSVVEAWPRAPCRRRIAAARPDDDRGVGPVTRALPTCIRRARRHQLQDAPPH